MTRTEKQKLGLPKIIPVARYVVAVMLMAVAWDSLIRIFEIPKYLLPAPSDVISTLGAERGMYFRHASATLQNMLGGVAIGLTLGVCAGFLLAYSRTLRWLFEPYLVIFQSFPREALVPVMVVWLGFGHIPKVVNAALLSFFPIAIITMNSLLDTRSEYLELVRSWGASKQEEFLYCRLPGALQAIVAGLKIAVPLGLIGAVLGEFMGGSEGLGYVIISSGANYRMDRSFASLVVLAVVGMVSLGAINFLQESAFARFKQE